MNALAITYPVIQPHHNALNVRLSKRYAVNGQPCFRLETKFTAMPGVTVILGHSGAGKSTLLRCVAGLCHPEQGRIAIGDRTLFDHSEKINLITSARKVGFVFQDLALFPHLTVQENVGYGLHRMNAAEREDRMALILESFHIAHLRKRLPRETSGGEQQRIALARSLVTEPCILLLDEPLSSLNVRMKASIIEDLRRWTEDQRIPILYVTHDHEEAFALGEYAIALHQGQIVAEGSPREVAAAPWGREVKKHTAAYENILKATVVAVHEQEGTMLCRMDGNAVELTVPLSPCEPGASAQIGIHAGEILLAGTKPEMLGHCNVVAGRILELIQNTTGTIVRVDCGAEFKVHLPGVMLESARLKPHAQVWLIIKTNACCVLHTRPAGATLMEIAEKSA